MANTSTLIPLPAGSPAWSLTWTGSDPQESSLEGDLWVNGDLWNTAANSEGGVTTSYDPATGVLTTDVDFANWVYSYESYDPAGYPNISFGQGLYGGSNTSAENPVLTLPATVASLVAQPALDMSATYQIQNADGVPIDIAYDTFLTETPATSTETAPPPGEELEVEIFLTSDYAPTFTETETIPTWINGELVDAQWGYYAFNGGAGGPSVGIELLNQPSAETGASIGLYLGALLNHLTESEMIAAIDAPQNLGDNEPYAAERITNSYLDGVALGSEFSPVQQAADGRFQANYTYTISGFSLSAVTIAPAPSGLSFAVAADQGASGDTFTVSGMGVAGDTVTLYDGTTTVGTTTVAIGNTWSITLPGPLGIGTHSLTAKEAGSVGGQSLASPAQTLTVTSATPNEVTFIGTAGTDNFTGGSGNDFFDFSAANLAATDTVVGGGGTDHLIMTTSGTINARDVGGVGIYDLASDGANTLVLRNANFSGVTGRIVVNGGSGGNTFDAAALTASDLVNLIGGTGNDTFEFSAAGLTASDKIVGGGGTDRLVATTAGTISAGDVSGLGIYNLAGGGVNTLKLTSANFTDVPGGRITVNGGSGGNIFDAAALSASDLVNLIGGDGNDTFEFTAAGLTASDKIVGGGSNGPNLYLEGNTDRLKVTTAGTINVGGVSGVEIYDLVGGGPNSLTLTNANFVGVTNQGAWITVNGGNDGNTFNLSAVTASEGIWHLIGGASNDTFILSGRHTLGAGSDEIRGGGGTDTVQFTTAGGINLASVSGIAIYDLAGSNDLTLKNANFAGVTGDLITVNGGSGGNVIDASALTGSNEVDLEGGADKDFFEFSATSLLAGDTIVGGGGGTDQLDIETPGTINAEGVSGVGVYNLDTSDSAGPSTLTLANSNFVGLTDKTITVNGANVGSNDGSTINAAALTGPNAVVLVGGAGNDEFTVAQNATMTGAGGDDVFGFTTPGTLAAPDANTITDFNSSTDEITFSDAGFDLGLSGASATPTALPTALFTSNATGAFTSATQCFAYDTSTGALYYDSQGNTAGSTSLLVATLSGSPALTAADLFYVT